MCLTSAGPANGRSTNRGGLAALALLGGVFETAPRRGGRRPDAGFESTGEARQPGVAQPPGLFVRVIAAYPTLDRIDTIILSVHPLP